MNRSQVPEAHLDAVRLWCYFMSFQGSPEMRSEGMEHHSHEEPAGLPQQPLGPVTGRLVTWAAGQRDDTLDEVGRSAAYGLVGGYLSILVNLVLFAVKLVLGLMAGSIALVADAAHTASDSITSAVVILAAYHARRPPDREHPWGHGRSEAVGTVVIAVLLGVIGVELGKESVLRLASPEPLSAPWWIIAVVLATAVAKEWLARYAQRLGERSGNRALMADVWHHRSDVWATVLVALGMVGARYGFVWLDGAAGLLVSLLILWVALRIARESVDTLLGSAPSPQEVAAVKLQAAEVEGVIGVHDVVIHRYGARVFISLHIETSSELDALTLHQIATRVERRVQRSGHGSVCVHMDPIQRDHPSYHAVLSALERLVGEEPEAESFHDLRLSESDEEMTILLDLRLVSEARSPEALCHRITEALQGQFPGAEVVIEVDPEFAY